MIHFRLWYFYFFLLILNNKKKITNYEKRMNFNSRWLLVKTVKHATIWLNATTVIDSSFFFLIFFSKTLITHTGIDRCFLFSSLKILSGDYKSGWRHSHFQGDNIRLIRCTDLFKSAIWMTGLVMGTTILPLCDMHMAVEDFLIFKIIFRENQAGLLLYGWILSTDNNRNVYQHYGIIGDPVLDVTWFAGPLCKN